MTWSDEPTYAQISCICNWLSWHLPTEEAQRASTWLKEHATRHEVSDEMGRLRKLHKSHQLDRKNCFESDVWEGYDTK